MTRSKGTGDRGRLARTAGPQPQTQPLAEFGRDYGYGRLPLAAGRKGGRLNQCSQGRWFPLPCPTAWHTSPALCLRLRLGLTALLAAQTACFPQCLDTARSSRCVVYRQGLPSCVASSPPSKLGARYSQSTAFATYIRTRGSAGRPDLAY